MERGRVLEKVPVAS
jgi:hypothetical protein